MKKNCVVCGKEFESRNSRQVAHAGECSKERQRARNRERRKDPKNRERQRELVREWYKDPKNRERHLARQREWLKDPKNRERQRARQREWLKDPKNRECSRLYLISRRRKQQISTNLFKLVADLNKLKQHLAKP